MLSRNQDPTRTVRREERVRPRVLDLAISGRARLAVRVWIVCSRNSSIRCGRITCGDLRFASVNLGDHRLLYVVLTCSRAVPIRPSARSRRIRSSRMVRRVWVAVVFYVVMSRGWALRISRGWRVRVKLPEQAAQGAVRGSSRRVGKEVSGIAYFMSMSRIRSREIRDTV